ncbi:predicted protein [Uncinocarpus reesii 1704]|uniref:Proteasome assembly chaperone 3 n=1 Tax=Uncinocarpus reesii (strain UAMH 1704) TaxID=336963 RepID=C4JY23_UNCRE|nr:uncharacterized protein UREG_07074 [Uncinocarpus reesii 1704]EEP82209.1 predicted protein [Uncinocarpus reesii 1704]
MTQGSDLFSIAPSEISFPLPKAVNTTLHIHLTFFATTATVFLTTTSTGESQGTTRPMGSLVYAIPDRFDPKNTMTTALYTSPGTIDHARRTAQALARRMNIPVFVGCSIDLSGQVVEEEAEGLAKIVDTIMRRWELFKGEKEEQG